MIGRLLSRCISLDSKFESTSVPPIYVRSQLSPEIPMATIPHQDQSNPSTAPRILIVEDDRSLGKFLGRELTHKRFSVQLSNDGESACEELRRAIPDLVILDLNLPGMDGMVLLKQVRLSQPRLPILVLTARNRT